MSHLSISRRRHPLALLWPVQHCVERQGGTPTTACAAGTPTRLVRSNALLYAPRRLGTTRIPRPSRTFYSRFGLGGKRQHPLAMGATAIPAGLGNRVATRARLVKPDGRRGRDRLWAHRSPVPGKCVQHRRSPAKRASTTACEAGAPTRFVWCNALFDGPVIRGFTPCLPRTGGHQGLLPAPW